VHDGIEGHDAHYLQRKFPLETPGSKPWFSPWKVRPWKVRPWKTGPPNLADRPQTGESGGHNVCMRYIQ
jgi:hypothetical protein